MGVHLEVMGWLAWIIIKEQNREKRLGGPDERASSRNTYGTGTVVICIVTKLSVKLRAIINRTNDFQTLSAWK
jgi:hypothetical protein